MLTKYDILCFRNIMFESVAPTVEEISFEVESFPVSNWEESFLKPKSGKLPLVGQLVEFPQSVLAEKKGPFEVKTKRVTVTKGFPELLKPSEKREEQKQEVVEEVATQEDESDLPKLEASSSEPPAPPSQASRSVQIPPKTVGEKMAEQLAEIRRNSSFGEEGVESKKPKATLLVEPSGEDGGEESKASLGSFADDLKKTSVFELPLKPTSPVSVKASEDTVFSRADDEGEKFQANDSLVSTPVAVVNTDEKPAVTTPTAEVEAPVELPVVETPSIEPVVASKPVEAPAEEPVAASVPVQAPVLATKLSEEAVAAAIPAEQPVAQASPFAVPGATASPFETPVVQSSSPEGAAVTSSPFDALVASAQAEEESMAQASAPEESSAGAPEPEVTPSAFEAPTEPSDASPSPFSSAPAQAVEPEGWSSPVLEGEPRPIAEPPIEDFFARARQENSWDNLSSEAPEGESEGVAQPSVQPEPEEVASPFLMADQVADPIVGEVPTAPAIETGDHGGAAYDDYNSNVISNEAQAEEPVGEFFEKALASSTIVQEAVNPFDSQSPNRFEAPVMAGSGAEQEQSLTDVFAIGTAQPAAAAASWEPPSNPSKKGRFGTFFK